MVSSCSGYDALGQERNIGKAVDIVQRIKADISTRWMDKIKIQNLIPRFCSSGMNLFTIPRFVTEQTIEREKDSRRNGSTIETVLPEPLPPTTRILLFSPFSGSLY